MKIRVTTAYLPAVGIARENAITFEEQIFFKLLQEDEEFMQKVKEIRQLLQIVPNVSIWEKETKRALADQLLDLFENHDKGIIAYKQAGNTVLSHMQNDLDLLYFESKSFCKIYNVPPGWYVGFAYFIAFNVFPVPNDAFHIRAFGKNDPYREFHENEDNVIIVVRQKITVEELRKWISENKPLLEQKISLLPSHPRRYLPSIDVYISIIKLLKNGVTSNKQICTELFNQNKAWNFTEAYTKTLVNRCKSILKSFKRPLE